MGTFATTYLPEDVQLLGNIHPVIGTAMLGDAFGKIKSLKNKRTGEEQELMNGAGTLRAHVTGKPGFEATLEATYDKAVKAPRIYQRITIPLGLDDAGNEVTIAAFVMQGVEVTYEDGKERTLSIPVKLWDSLKDAAVYRLDTKTQLKYLQDIGVPVVTPTPGSGSIALDWPDVPDADSYLVQASSDSGVTWATINSPTLSTYTHTVTTGQTRKYRVAAVSTADGQGEWSPVVTATAA